MSRPRSIIGHALTAPVPPNGSEASSMLRRVRLFHDWPPQHLATVLHATRLIDSPPGHQLLGQGESPNSIYVIAAGSVEVASMHVDGRRFVRRYAGPGMLFGLISILDGNGSPYTYTAQTFSTVALIPKDTFLGVLSTYPDMWCSVARFVATFQRIALSTIDEHMFVPLQARLARTLLSLARDQPREERTGKAATVTITQDNLASLLGVSRQSISKQLKRLERRKRIRVTYARVELLDYGAIERLAIPENAPEVQE